MSAVMNNGAPNKGMPNPGSGGGNANGGGSGNGPADQLAGLKSENIWKAGLRRFLRKPVARVCLVIVSLFMLMIALSFVGAIASNWQQERGVPDANPTFLGKPTASDGVIVEKIEGQRSSIKDVDPLAARYEEWEKKAASIQIAEVVRSDTLPFGADRLGRDVLSKVIKGSEISIGVGLVAALLATLIGTTLGAIGGFFGGKTGDLLEWVYNVFTSIPNILLIFAFAAVLGRGVSTVVIILGFTGWTGIYRLVRAEYIKHRSREYVKAAEAIGVPQGGQMFRHILPNVSHVVLVQLSILIVGFIKAEVILSFLGLGVPLDAVSWGTMLSESQSDLLRGKWWQLAAATVFMATFVTAFSLMADALRDALDPKLIDSSGR
jgi:oligopeptide transport system permease protein